MKDELKRSQWPKSLKIIYLYHHVHHTNVDDRLIRYFIQIVGNLRENINVDTIPAITPQRVQSHSKLQQKNLFDASADSILKIKKEHLQNFATIKLLNSQKSRTEKNTDGIYTAVTEAVPS